MSAAPTPLDSNSSPVTALSLRGRVVATVALVLLLFSALCSGVIVSTAREAISEEVEASMTLARSLSAALVRIVGDGGGSTDLPALVETLSSIRHVRIGYRSAAADDWRAYAASVEAAHSPVPRWFERLVLPPDLPAHVMLRVPPPHHGMLILAPYAHDELLESWREARTWLLFLLATSSVACIAIFVVVGRSLRPLAALDAALQRIQDGDLGTSLQGRAVPEIAQLNRRFNEMAASLQVATTENRRLARDLAETQTRERRWLAHELHDEMSPNLFKIRVDLLGIMRGLHDAGDNAALRPRVDSAHQLVVHLQQWVKRLLRDLHPLVLDELGLVAAVQALVDDWRARVPDVEWQFAEAVSDVPLDPTTTANVYRIAEEALANAARHAGAARIHVSLATVSSDAVASMLMLTVTDDGTGEIAKLQPNVGLRSMRDRARSLGGDCSIEACPPRGLRLSVRVPLASAAGGVGSAPSALGSDGE